MAYPIANSRLSPAANILRNSRLFALPPPIIPPSSFPTTKPTGSSDTATTPYPTHASIQTTDSSRMRGDWGLKRPLPLRSTSGASATIRVHGIDTINHITDFASANDHTLTLEKWQSLYPVIKLPDNRSMYEDQNVADRSPSVFEEWVDNARDVKDPNAFRATRAARKQPGRWIFQGPNVAHQTDTAFSAYVEKHVRPRKAEFLSFVRQKFIQQSQYEQQRIARDQGEQATPPEITPTAFRNHLKSLRTNRDLLGRLIHQFLDLPPTPIPGTSYSSAQQTPFGRAGEIGTLPPSTTYYSTYGPPLTHPSAGFSYLRSRAHTPNHPLLGPQIQSAPVQARVLQSKTKEASAASGRAILGVGGLTAAYSRTFNDKSQEPGITTFDPSIPGGTKVYVQPSHFHVDSRGKIQFSVLRANSDAVAIYTAGKNSTDDGGKEVPKSRLPNVVKGESQMPMLSSRSGKPPSGYGLEGTMGGELSRTRYEYGEKDNGLGEGAQGLIDILKPEGKRGLL
jgi:hypothetical protein